MDVKNEWMRIILALAMYLSCLVVAIAVFQIPKELSTNNEIPLRIIVLLCISAIIWFTVAWVSKEPAWKSLTKLSGYTLALFFIGVGAFGISQTLGHMFNKPTELSLLWSVSVSVLAFASALGVGKVVYSKWLN